MHDQWFHLPYARRDGDAFLIPFVVEETDEIEVLARTFGGRPKRWRVPLYRAELRVANVEDVRVDDRGQLETFMCVDLAYDETEQTIHIEAAEAADLYIKVGHLDVALSRSDERAGYDHRRQFLFVGEASGPPELAPWPAPTSD